MAACCLTKYTHFENFSFYVCLSQRANISKTDSILTPRANKSKFDFILTHSHTCVTGTQTCCNVISMLAVCRFRVFVFHQRSSDCIFVLHTTAKALATLRAVLWTSCGRALSCGRWVATPKAVIAVKHPTPTLESVLLIASLCPKGQTYPKLISSF